MSRERSLRLMVNGRNGGWFEQGKYIYIYIYIYFADGSGVLALIRLLQC